MRIMYFRMENWTLKMIGSNWRHWSPGRRQRSGTRCSDVWLVKHIGENPYLQYFIGMKEYGPCPFGASTLVAFRKRFSEEDMAAILEASIPRPEKSGNDEDNNDPPNDGTLVLDATCCPTDIAYPQDVNLLNQAREKLEQTVDEICESTGEKKPRMYRKCARRDFLRLSKSKKCSTKAIRSAIKKQLQYIRRDIGYIVQFVQNGIFLSSTYIDSLTDADSVLLSAHTSAYRDCQSVLHQRIQCPHLVMDVSLYSDCLKRTRPYVYIGDPKYALKHNFPSIFKL